MIRQTLQYLVVAVSITGSVALQAHHSLAGVYDTKGEKVLVGTIAKIQYVNPHGSLTLSVKNPDGTVGLKSIDGYFLHADAAGVWATGEATKFTLEFTDGYVSLKTPAGKYVSAQP